MTKRGKQAAGAFKPMSAYELETIRHALGFTNRRSFAQWLGLGLRTVDGYVEGRSGVPKAVAMLLRLMVSGRIDPEKLAALPPFTK